MFLMRGGWRYAALICFFTCFSLAALTAFMKFDVVHVMCFFTIRDAMPRFIYALFHAAAYADAAILPPLMLRLHHIAISLPCHYFHATCHDCHFHAGC